MGKMYFYKLLGGPLATTPEDTASWSKQMLKPAVTDVQAFMITII